jgi:hypothetical protein
MKRKNNFFLIGMTSVLLAFAMIGCDNGTTTKTEYVNTGGGNPVSGGQGVTSAQQLAIAIASGAPGTYRIISSFPLAEDLLVNKGQHIVVGGEKQSGDQLFSAGSAVDGPLFNAAYSSNHFNINKKLTLAEGSSLTIAKGAGVTATSGGELHVSKGAAVGVGVDVSGTGENIGSSGLSSLHVVGGGSLYFEDGATLAVTNDPEASKVKLETASSAITLETGATLDIAGTGTVAANVIGGSGNVVIEIPATAPAAIGEVEVTVEGPSDEAAAIKTAVKDAVKASPSRTTDKATTEGSGDTEVLGVQALLDKSGVTRVTYTGTGALTDISIGNGQTLVISGAVTEQAAAIGGEGTLEITGSVTTANTIAADALASLVKAGGGGKVVLKTGSNVAATGVTLEVNLTLEIEADATIALGATGNIDILDDDENITGTIVNKGTISTEQNINAANGFGEFLALVGGTFEVKGSGKVTVDAGDTLIIPTGATLSLTDTASVTGAAGAKIVIQGSGSITGAGNFYNKTGDTALSTIPPDTYTWDTTKPGWRGTQTALATVRDTSDVTKVEWETEPNILTINYSGATALTGTYAVVPEGKTLIISGTLDQGTNAISGNGTLEIAASTGSLTTSAALSVKNVTNNNNIDLGTTGTITSSGTVENNGTIKTASTALATILAKVTAGEVQVTGNVALDSAEIQGTATLKVASGTLTINENQTLKVTTNATLAVETSSALTNSGTIEAANAAKLAAVLALGTKLNGKVAVVGDVEIVASSGTLTIPTGVTLTLAESQELTASGTIEGAGSINAEADGSSLVVDEDGGFTLSGGTVTGDVTQDVTSSYTLPTDTEDFSEYDETLYADYTEVQKNYLDGSDNTKITIASAKKSLATTGEGAGFITIKLTADDPIADEEVVDDELLVDFWMGWPADEEKTTTGNFAIATIKGLFDSVKTQNKTVKNFNPSWAYYKGQEDYFSNIVTVSAPDTAPTTAGGGNNLLWLGSDNIGTGAFNWSYRAGSSGSPDDDELTLLLWSGPTSGGPITKQAKLEIAPSSGTAYTVIVDWSGVTINAPTE